MDLKSAEKLNRGLGTRLHKDVQYGLTTAYLVLRWPTHLLLINIPPPSHHPTSEVDLLISTYPQLWMHTSGTPNTAGPRSQPLTNTCMAPSGERCTPTMFPVCKKQYTVKSKPHWCLLLMSLWCCTLVLKKYMWQSRVEIEGYSIAYFNRIAAFKAPYHWTSVKGVTHMRFVDSLVIHASTKRIWAPPLMEVQQYGASNAAWQSKYATE